MVSAFYTVPGMPFEVVDHDPDAHLDYHLPFDDWLGDNTIVSAAWTAAAGVTVEASSINSVPVTIDGVEYPAGTVCEVWISAISAKVGSYYPVSVRITDNEASPGPRIRDKTFLLKIKHS